MSGETKYLLHNTGNLQYEKHFTLVTWHSASRGLRCAAVCPSLLASGGDDDDLQRKQRKNTSRKSAKDGREEEERSERTRQWSKSQNRDPRPVIPQYMILRFQVQNMISAQDLDQKGIFGVRVDTSLETRSLIARPTICLNFKVQTSLLIEIETELHI